MKNSGQPTLGNPWRQKAKARAAETHPAPSPTPPDPPSWLSAEARQLWDQHAGDAHRHGALTQLDVLCFALLCERLSDYLAYRAVVATEGAVVRREHYEGAHPCVKAAADAAAGVVALLDRLALSPKSRQGVKLKPPEAAQIRLFVKD